MPRREAEYKRSSDAEMMDAIPSARKKEFSRAVCDWMRVPERIRNFLWRLETDEYRIMISEVLLRRTNAKSANRVYEEFITRFPTLDSFKVAEPEELYRVTKKAGLEWRARNVVQLAQALRSMTTIPSEIPLLEKLPGVGPYVARAVAVNAWDRPCVPVDANIVRLLSRYFGLSGSDSLRRNRRFQSFADELLPPSHWRKFNHALLDLCALHCVAMSPRCRACPLYDKCKHAKSID